MATHSYAASYPDLSVDPAVKKFFEDFYAISDDSTAIESYAALFTDDAAVTMASKSVKGTTEITTFRQGMWTHVKARKHTVFQIYPFGNGSNEIMIRGAVEYTFRKDGKVLNVPWAGHAVVDVKNGEGLKLSQYHVYMDTAPVAEALK